MTSNFVTPEILEFLDPSVKSFHIKQTEKNVNIRLEFKNGRKYTINDLSDLNLYLSSGTIKGMMVYSVASLILKNGGCLMVDEIENHFNKELVLTLIRFFMDNTVNTGGGVLFFSTHYAELLDEFERNDSIYFARNGNGIDIRSLNADLKRNDLKKSEVYQSGYTGGTTPDYEAYLKLKKSFQRRSATK